MAQSNDPTGYDYVDPDTLLQQEADQYNTQIGNTRSSADFNATVMNRGGQIASGGGPAVQQAMRTQQRLKQIMQNVNENSPDDEDPITKNMRLAVAVSSGMADVNPQMALAANQQALKLQQAITQQKYVNAHAGYESSLGQVEQVKADTAKLAARFQVYDSGADPKDKLPSYKPYGDPVSLYKPDGSIDQDFAVNISKAMDDAKKAGATSPNYQTVDAFQNGKGAVADMRNRAVLEEANRKAALKEAATVMADPNVLRPAVAEILMNPARLRDLPSGSREPVLAYMTANGLSPFDGINAQAEAKALNSAATAVGRRDGITAFLGGSVPKLGDNVVDALGDVDRTRFPIINQGIILGKSLVGNPDERKYAASIQSFINEYARVISGGGSITSDAARNEAHALLSKADSPESIRSVVSFLKNKELEAVNNAAPAALELINNPNRYPHIAKIAQALGYDGTTAFGVTPSAPAPLDSTPPAAAHPGQSTGWGKAAVVSQ